MSRFQDSLFETADLPMADLWEIAEKAPVSTQDARQCVPAPVADIQSFPRPLILWGRRSDSEQWIKLSDNTSNAEMKRREKDGWKVLRYAAGNSPNDIPTSTPEDETADPRKCLQCGKRFAPKGNQLFCTAACRAKFVAAGEALSRRLALKTRIDGEQPLF